MALGIYKSSRQIPTRNQCFGPLQNQGEKQSHAECRPAPEIKSGRQPNSTREDPVKNEQRTMIVSIVNISIKHLD